MSPKRVPFGGLLRVPIRSCPTALQMTPGTFGTPKASRIGLILVLWALAYHTLILFFKGTHYEIKVYTFFSLVT